MLNDLNQRWTEIVQIGPSGIDLLIPVFVTTTIPQKLVDDFFAKANEATRYYCFETPQSVLVDDLDRSKLKTPTSPPVSEKLMRHNPVLNWNLEELLEWLEGEDSAARGLLTAKNFIVLDAQTVEDQESCLLVALADKPISPNSIREKGLQRLYHVLRSDFDSSVINLKTSEVGQVGSDEMLDTDYEGFDGVLRNRVRDEWERREYGR